MPERKARTRAGRRPPDEDRGRPIPDPGAVTYGLPRSMRLRTQREFRRVYRRGSRVRGKNMVVVGLPRRQPGFRVGLSVSKSNGAAVRRNKIKRLFREAFRLERPTLPGRFDLVLIPQARQRYQLAEMRTELITLVRELCKGGRHKPGRRRRHR